MPENPASDNENVLSDQSKPPPEQGEPRLTFDVPFVWKLFFPGMPWDVYQHLRAARRECLLAARSMLDARITALDQDESSRARRSHRITID